MVSPALLTARERTILAEMAEGLSNAQIGKRLFVSENTVKTQVRAVFQKLNVESRAQAVAIGFRRVWLQ